MTKTAGSVELACIALTSLLVRAFMLLLLTPPPPSDVAFVRTLHNVNAAQSLLAFLIIGAAFRGRFIDTRRDRDLMILKLIETFAFGLELGFALHARLTDGANLWITIALCAAMLVVNICLGLVGYNERRRAWTAEDYERQFRRLFCCVAQAANSSKFKTLGVFSLDFFGSGEISLTASDLVAALCLLQREQDQRLSLTFRSTTSGQLQAPKPKPLTTSMVKEEVDDVGKGQGGEELESALASALQLLPYATSIYGTYMFEFFHGPSALASLVADAAKRTKFAKTAAAAARAVHAHAHGRGGGSVALHTKSGRHEYGVNYEGAGIDSDIYELSLERAIELSTTGTMGNMVYLALHDEPGQCIPFAVFLDTVTKSIVVSMRGTQSLEDTMTDLLAVGELDSAGEKGEKKIGELGLESLGTEFGFDGSGEVAHHAFTHIALSTVAELRSVGVLDLLLFGKASPPLSPALKSPVNAALQDVVRRACARRLDELRTAEGFTATTGGLSDFGGGGWGVQIVGHSLGAGVAAIAALLLRSKYKQLGVEVRCTAFSCPLATLSPRLAKSMAPFVTTVVLGNDVVCRASVHGLERARDRTLALLAQCAVSPAAVVALSLAGVWIDTFFCCCTCARRGGRGGAGTRVADAILFNGVDTDLTASIVLRSRVAAAADASSSKKVACTDGEQLLIDFATRQRVDIDRDGDAGITHTAMQSPGRVLHLTLDAPAYIWGMKTQTYALSFATYTARGAKRCVKPPRYRATFLKLNGSEEKALQEIVLTRTLLDDHFPFKVGFALESALEGLRGGESGGGDMKVGVVDTTAAAEVKVGLKKGE